MSKFSENDSILAFWQHTKMKENGEKLVKLPYQRKSQKLMVAFGNGK
jgi:hypothetical protein